MNYKLYQGDCLEVMDKLIEEGIKVDAIITDPPYGTTRCKWDNIIPFDEMPRRLILTFPDKETYLKNVPVLDRMFADSEGADGITVICRKERAQKNYPPSQNIHIDEALLGQLRDLLGAENVKVR